MRRTAGRNPDCGAIQPVLARAPGSKRSSTVGMPDPHDFFVSLAMGRFNLSTPGAGDALRHHARGCPCGCSHPWVKSASANSNLSDLEVFSLGGPALTSQPGAIPPRNFPSPCALGACSRSPDEPASWPPSVSSQVELWADLPAARPALVLPFRTFSPLSGQLRRSESVSLLERPPRSTLSR